MPGGGADSEPSDICLNQLSLEYAYPELQQATRNFEENSQIGHGSFGGVFRGIQRDGTEVAIKVLDVPEEAGFEEEVRVLSKFRHPNLVILMGFAREASRRFLVYELLAGGDVYRRLQKSCLENVTFSWRQRVSVAFDAACGLSHLHHASPKVFHRDIKSPNILLDRNGTAKMADFGLACLSHNTTHKVKQASGTVGYACPFYVQRGVVTEGSEVYSFGIVMLELLTASPPAYVTQAKDGSQQYQFLVTHLNGELRMAMSMADPKAQWLHQANQDFATLALRCITMTEEHRPGFADVVNVLRDLRDIPEPKVQAPTMPNASTTVAQSGPRYHDRGVVFGRSGSAVANGGGQLATGQPPQMLLGVSAGGIPVLAQSFPQHQPHFIAQQQQSAIQAASMVYQTPANAPQAGPWSVDNTFRICGEGEESWFVGQAPLLDRNIFTSVSIAVEHLNYGSLACPEGFCVVFSASSRAYFLLYLPELQEFAYAKFKVFEDPIVQQPTIGRGPSKEHLQLPPILWTLECIYSEGTCLSGLAREQRALVHRQELGGPLVRDLRVGRLFQEEFLSMVVQDEQSRALLCREHFQIWAEEMVQAPNNGGRHQLVPCSFFLTNVNVNGTIVNGQHVHSTNEQVPLHDGDLIALPRLERQTASDVVKLTPWLQFRFDLSRSVLSDGDSADDARGEVAGSLAAKPLGRNPPLPSNSIPEPSNGYAGSENVSSARDNSEPACLGTSFVGVEMTPLFVLEVGGPAVRRGAAAELRRIVHGVPTHTEEVEACPPLLLGRAQQSGFWQRLLCDEAYNSLSRQHLQIEVVKGTSKAGTDDVEFCVRNLSDLNPIRVCTRVEDGFDAYPALERDERRLLCHGDTIVVNPSRDHMLWLVFEHLSSGKLEVASVAGGALVPAAKESFRDRRPSKIGM